MEISAPSSINETSPHDWKYISEGGATVVFAYVGSAHQRFSGKVLRLKKCSTCSPHGAPHQVHDDELEGLFIEFQQTCIARLVPPDYLPSLEAIDIQREWLESLIAVHDNERPEARKNVDEIDVTRRQGVLATDLVGGGGFAVEIKPKWGFLPSSSHISDDTRPFKLQTCRFCMHSNMKTRQGETVSFGYCPLDLFSKDVQRVRKAVDTLWNAWLQSGGKVNNLRIFKAGRKLSDRSELGEAGQEYIKAGVVKLLTESRVLQILGRLQRTLDPLDVEGVSELCNAADAATGSASKTLWSEPTLADWTNFIDTYLSGKEPEPQAETARHYLLSYLLSATFKDCSIMLRIGTGASFSANTNPKIIDLDPKKLTKFRYWERLDNEIVTSYSAVEDRRVCVDDGDWA